MLDDLLAQAAYIPTSYPSLHKNVRCNVDPRLRRCTTPAIARMHSPSYSKKRMFFQ
jgi:hypothetical protein